MFSEDEVKRRARKAKAKKSRSKVAAVVLFCLLSAATSFAHAQQKGYYFDAQKLDLTLLIPQPPAVDSAANKAELVELHSIEQARHQGTSCDGKEG